MTGSADIDWGALLASDAMIDPHLVWLDQGPPDLRPALYPLVVEDRAGSISTLRGDRDTLALLLRLSRPESGAIKRLQVAAIRGAESAGGNPAAVQILQRDAELTVLGVIDDGCPFAHSALRDRSGATLIQFLWDQNSVATGTRPPAWTRPAAPMSYGAQITAFEINRAIQQAENVFGRTAAAERAAYEALRYAALAPARGSPHGVGVLQAAAGEAWLASGKERPLELPIVFVQLPQAAVADTSGGWLGYYALDALDYIIDRAAALRGSVEIPLKLVVNLSYGGAAGPHDGRTLLECALEQRVRQHGLRDADVRLVLPAGNSFGKRVHAQRELASGASQTRFLIQVPPDKSTETFVEFWLDAVEDPARRTVTVTAPDGRSFSAAGGTAQTMLGGGHAVAGCIFPRQPAQSDVGHMALLAIAPTRLGAGPAAAPAGRWTVDIAHGAGGRATRVHGWVERDDLLTGIRRTQQARFVDDGSGYAPDPALDPLSPSDPYTLNSIANLKVSSDLVCVVGGYRIADGQVARYSSSGPARLHGSGSDRCGPEFSAPSDVSVAAHGIATGGVLSGSTRRTSGTSVAAAILSRRLLQGWACRPGGQHDPRMGTRVS